MVVLMEEDLYKMQLARLAFCGFKRDVVQDSSPGAVYAFYIKSEKIDGREYEFLAYIRDSGTIKLRVYPARQDFLNPFRLEELDIILLETGRAKVLAENLQSLEADISKDIKNELPDCQLSLHMTPPTMVGLLEMRVEETQNPVDEIYNVLKSYIQRKGKKDPRK
jgi:hypothetical protein